MNISDLKTLLDRAEQVRRPWESIFTECYDYALPNRTEFRRATNPAASREGQRNTDYIYDQTAVVGVMEFASRLQYNMMPPFATWARLVPGSQVPDEDVEEVQEQLDQINRIVFEELSQTTFDQEIHEAFMDLGVSQGHILIEPVDSPNELMNIRAVPLSNCFVINGADGKPKTIFYVEVLSVGQILDQYSEDIQDKTVLDELKRSNKDKQIKFVDCFNRERGTIRNPVWKRCRFICQPDSKVGDDQIYKGEGSSPWIVFRWSKATGESYGRGPLINALPSVRTVNALMEFTLEAAEWAVGGMYQADDDGTINPDTIVLEPRAIIPRARGSSIEPIQSGSDFNVGLELISHMQDAIKKALYNERLGPREGTPPTATEIQERMLELARDIGASFGRLQAELARPVIMRVLYLLDQKGLIEIPKVNGKVIDIEIQSPLARAQRIEDVQNLARFGELVQGIYGPQAALVALDQTEGVSYLAERLMLPMALVRDKEQAAQMLQTMMEQIQQTTSGPVAGPSNEGVPLNQLG